MTVSLDNRIIAAFNGGFDLAAHTIGAAYMGSHSHNTYVPSDDPDSIDDVDIMIVAVPPPVRTIGLREWEHWTFQFEELDVVAYSIRKFVGLLLKSNPNVVGLLWLRPDLYLHRHPAFDRLIENRDIFSSKTAYQAFSGYASAQLQKLETGAFKGYMGAKRKELVERFGYDCKMAAHAVRLLRMGSEFLETGILKVYRDEDADEIRAIKRGEWPIERIREEAQRGFERARAARDRSPLPDQPDFAASDRLLVEITFEIWRQTGSLTA
jgi:uncharacterized protein